jgi:hypothetical protein
MPKYRVLIGLNYPPGDKRAEPGDIVDDIPPGSAGWLLDAGAIEEIGKEKKKSAPDAEKEDG